MKCTKSDLLFGLLLPSQFSLLNVFSFAAIFFFRKNKPIRDNYSENWPITVEYFCRSKTRKLKLYSYRHKFCFAEIMHKNNVSNTDDYIFFSFLSNMKSGMKRGEKVHLIFKTNVLTRKLCPSDFTIKNEHIFKKIAATKLVSTTNRFVLKNRDPMIGWTLLGYIQVLKLT